jgi:glucokinase
MEKSNGFCEIEQVCCGYGLVNIYNFLYCSQKNERAPNITPEEVENKI